MLHELLIQLVKVHPRKFHFSVCPELTVWQKYSYNLVNTINTKLIWTVILSKRTVLWTAFFSNYWAIFASSHGPKSLRAYQSFIHSCTSIGLSNFFINGEKHVNATVLLTASLLAHLKLKQLSLLAYHLHFNFEKTFRSTKVNLCVVNHHIAIKGKIR